MVRVDDMIENLTGFIESKIELVKLDVKNEGTRIGVNVAVGAIVGLFGLLTLLCLTVALGLWLGSLVDSNALGFLLAAAAFMVLSVLLMLSKAGLQKVVQKRVFPKYKG